MRQEPPQCGVADNDPLQRVKLPRNARSLFNRTNLTTEALGSLAFQGRPRDLELVGIRELHASLFTRLETLKNRKQRAQQFLDYMAVHFRLEAPEEAGYTTDSRIQRNKVDYQKILRGWLFNPDGREAAVLKGWVASRFGLLPRHHEGPLDDPESEPYLRFLSMQSAGLFNTNALESQLDVLYAFCQYELKRRFSDQDHWLLFRGVNQIDQYDLLQREPGGRAVVLLNNLNSFSEDRERADEFGDYILEARIPLSKIMFFHGLLPGAFKGEGEVMVIGGLYEVLLHTY
ncbi:MAG: NAD(+)--dinitrogen-reductase ADP-D-ribosyltransferase [Magnetococcus sp. WYHC-3]